MRHCTANMHWWEVGETHIEELLMKQSISELYSDMKMTSKVGIRCGFFFERRTCRNNKQRLM